MVVSFTACHLDSVVRPRLLRLMVDSLLSHAAVEEIYISVSFCGSIFDASAQRAERERLERAFEMHGRIRLFWQTAHFFQFDHLRFLFSVYSGCDAVLFIDDDDLLLRLPPFADYDIVVGHGIANAVAFRASRSVTASETDKLACAHHRDFLSREDVLTKCAASSSSYLLMDTFDFSGYIVQHKHLSGFFPAAFERIDGCAAYRYLYDVVFTGTYLKGLPMSRVLGWQESEAFVYHRIWATEDRTSSAWRRSTR